MAQQLRLKSQKYSAKEIVSYAVDVLVDTGITHLNKPFTYAVSEKLGKLEFGSLVSVPFGSKLLPGIVLQIQVKHEENLRFIKKVIHRNPVITRDQYKIFEEATKRWTGSIWTFIKFAVPSIPAKFDVPIIGDSGISRKVENPELRIGETYEDLVELIKNRVNPSRQLLVVVPDSYISNFLRSSIGKNFLEYGSHLSTQERVKNYLSILAGNSNLILGNRSAIFLPLKSDAEILIVDDLSFAYYEARHPYWNVRDIALLRASRNAVTFYCHSPSLELVRLVESGWMKVRQKKGSRGNYYFHNERISYQTVIKKALKSGAVLVITPERGYVNALVCAKCKNLHRCQICSGRLIQASATGKPECQICGAVSKEMKCSYCESDRVLSFSKGLDKTAEELGKQFPNTEIRKLNTGAFTNKKNIIYLSNYGSVPIVSYSAVVLLGFEKFAYQNKLRSTELARKALFDLRATKSSEYYFDFESNSYFGQSIQIGDSFKSAVKELADRTAAKLPPEFRLITIDCDSKSASIFEEQDSVDAVTFSSGKTVVRVTLKNAAKFSEFLGEVINYRSLRKLKPWNVKVDPLDI